MGTVSVDRNTATETQTHKNKPGKVGNKAENDKKPPKSTESLGPNPDPKGNLYQSPCRATLRTRRLMSTETLPQKYRLYKEAQGRVGHPVETQGKTTKKQPKSTESQGPAGVEEGFLYQRPTVPPQNVLQKHATKTQTHKNKPGKVGNNAENRRNRQNLRDPVPARLPTGTQWGEGPHYVNGTARRRTVDLEGFWGQVGGGDGVKSRPKNTIASLLLDYY
jgi:hypothetical protein